MKKSTKENAELLEEATSLLEEIFDEGSLEPHRNEDGDGELYHSSARLLVFMSKIGHDIDPEDLKDAIDKIEGE